MIELYVFDMGGVLCRGSSLGPAMADHLRIPLTAWRELSAPDMQALMRGELSDEEWWRRFEERSGLRAAEDLWESLFSPVTDLPTEDLVRSLKGQGRRVVCGTNTMGPHYAAHLALGHYDVFDKVYASHLMGLAKPEPEFWLHILAAEGVAPDRTLFVDDLQENVEAAAGLGIKALLYTGAPVLARDLAALGLPVPNAAGAD